MRGDLTLDRAHAAPIDTAAGMLMGAFGARGALVEAAIGASFELTAAHGLVLRMRSEAALGLAASTAEVQRLQLLLGASSRGMPLASGLLPPEVEVGGRYDGRRRPRPAWSWAVT